MVDRGQFLERMTVIGRPSSSGAGAPDAAFGPNDTVLEGLYQAGGGGLAHPVLLLSGLPAAGGTMEHAVLAELAWQLSRAGHPTLRFNYARRDDAGPRAVALTSEELDAQLSDERLRARYQADAVAALDHLVSTHPDMPVAAVGYGVGAWWTLPLLERPELCSAGLVGPAACPSLFAAAPPGADVFALLPELGAWVERDVLQEVLGDVPIDVVHGADPAFVRGLSELGARVVSRVAA